MPRSSSDSDEIQLPAGSLRNELEGSTDEAAWFDLKEVTELHRVELVDTARAMAARERF